MDRSLLKREDPNTSSAWAGEDSPRSQEEYDQAMADQRERRFLHGGLPDSSEQAPVRNPTTVAKFR